MTDEIRTLKDEGTPWAEEYRGSGRMTGRLAEEPVLMDTGDVAPGWQYVGRMNRVEFEVEFERQQHDHCHSRGRADFACLHCQRAGWVKRDALP